ncbi:uncharacterized protein PgNI_04639 [Pyricularia grisea]|uniref:Uncharacterized protein n=1 Tax=Pyricularia grisea TaxID=148305 RepID=A0A6P8BE75_PYRGI|nr:uncharacterized protein PgNI_04639 [Pyricularia grisea]TLD14123.1 hypothetical protein PgNI_04639 [Pyricularia grisea]
MDSFSKARAFFSKALPPPPPSEDSSSGSGSGNNNNTSKISKDDTIGNASSSGATSSSSNRVFPPRTTSTKPPPFSPPPPPSKLDSPLPRIQEQVAPSSLSKADSVRSPIPRRPVALPPSPKPVEKAPTPTKSSSLLSPTVPAPSQTPLLAPPSPAHSLYSLISAYSRDSEEPAVPQASQATEVSKNSSHVSPSPLGSDGKPQESPYTLPPLEFKDSPSSGIMFGDDKPPPPPIKDGVIPARKPLPLPSNTSSGQPAANATQAPLPPPPPPADDKKPQPPAEIWKRRSDKTDKPIGVSELKLTATNGSTSAPKINNTQPVQSISTVNSPHNPELLQQPGANLSAPDARLKSPQPPRSGGLPGRNIRPNAATETPTQNGSEVPTAASDSLSKTGTNGAAKLVDGTPAENKKENVTVQSQQDDAVRNLPDYHSQKQSQQQAQKQPSNQSPDAGIRRLPTPDYEQHDVKSPIVEHVASPVSPASSPDLISSYLDKKKPLPVVPSPASSPDQGPTVPEKALKPPANSAATLPASPAPKMGNLCSLPKSPRPRTDTKEPSVSSTRGSQTTKAQGSVKAPSVTEKTAESSTRSLQDPAPNPTPVAPAKSLEVQTPQNSQGQAQARSSSPSVDSNYNANATNSRDQFPVRTTSKAQGLPSSPLPRLNQEQQIAHSASITEAFLESDASTSQVSTVRPTTSQQQYQPNLLSPYEPRPPPPGSDGTIYKELVQSDDFDPAIARFPATKLTSDDVLSGSVYKMRSLSRSQLNCFHRHRFMVPTSNTNYPLACQTCTRADSEDRFRCKFCYLRICSSCRDVLAQNRGDLDALMAHVKTHGSSTAHAPLGSTNSNIAGVPGFPVVTAPA